MDQGEFTRACQHCLELEYEEAIECLWCGGIGVVSTCYWWADDGPACQ